jgi:hypothetical protein
VDEWLVFLLNDITVKAFDFGAHGLDPLCDVRSCIGLQFDTFQNQESGLVAPWQNVHVMSVQIL